MFQSAITCREFHHFIEVCEASEEEAKKLAIRYTNTDQDFLHEVIDAIHHGGKMPKTPFTEQECILQEKIARGDYKEILDEGHHKLGHF
jgi:hypothetical protein